MKQDGILNINKPQNMTSSQVVGAVRRILDVKKVGHTGTLDPMATGVLPICIGKAARIMDYLNFDLKKYRCTLVFGFVTDTQDVWGNVLEDFSTENLNEQMIVDAFKSFHGKIEQLPPMYSAVRIQGRHLYEYARKGQTPPEEIKRRRVYIENLQIENIDLENKEVSFVVSCSKGTYIRTICQNVGEYLGCGATMKSLERISTGNLSIENAISLEELEETKWANIIPTYYPLIHFGKVVVDKKTGIDFVNGWHVSFRDCLSMEEPKPIAEEMVEFVDPKLLKAYNVFMEDEGKEVFLGVCYYSSKYKKLVADKVFYRSNDNEGI